ncbi:hypothetical protein CI610_02676 [invertebrate metagenome]|uniref:Tryptophan synthase subunit beta like protein n=1 Tax=invertebrate metagenome TaxID=1711999 RepID=A0A2H9T5A3_9ZZZZ
MLFALRDENRVITAVSEQSLSEEWEAVDVDSPELLEFLQKNPSAGSNVMQASDGDFIRVLEDVIDLLIHKQIIQFTELPNAAQKKLLSRRRCREEIRQNTDTTQLLDDDEELL